MLVTPNRTSSTPLRYVAEAYADLVAKGVHFVQEPTALGPVVVATLDDTCGNLIQISSPA